MPKGYVAVNCTKHNFMLTFDIFPNKDGYRHKIFMAALTQQG